MKKHHHPPFQFRTILLQASHLTAAIALIYLGSQGDAFALDQPIDRTCPQTDLGETSQDCPWSDWVRRFETAIGNQTFSAHLLWDTLPLVRSQIEKDRIHAAVLNAWGESINFDELAKSVIVAPPVLNTLLIEANQAPLMPCGNAGSPTESLRQCAHAGLTHTYGYLLSNLRTPFGYKRARWVKGEIEAGLGLPAGSVGPTPQSGTLLTNVTHLATKLAFQTQSPTPTENVTLSAWQPNQALRSSLIETVKASEHTLKIRTDFYPFKKMSEEGSPSSGNSHLLVYSYQIIPMTGTVHSPTPATEKLITIFPVEESFVQRALAPSVCGDGGTDAEIFSRYNGWIPVLGAARVLGTRQCILTKN
jgi:hypothetical protein